MPSSLSIVGPAEVRSAAPLVQCITNTVVQAFTANALLAVGASPAMVDNPEDAGDFAAIASGMLVNFGTPNAQHYGAAEVAIPVLDAASKPWVLDPVGIGAMPHRTGKIVATAAKRPTIVRGNASEVAALAGLGAGGRGVDSTDSVDSAIDAALLLAGKTGGAVAVSGPVDAIVAVDEGVGHIVRIDGGDPLLASVIGTGCALGAICVAYAAAAAPGSGPLGAAVGAHAHLAAAGTLAATRASEPGSYAVALIDALSEVSAGKVAIGDLVETRHATIDVAHVTA